MDLIVEVISRTGRLLQRSKICSDSARVGRGYHNDVIITDPYVCASHVALEFDPEQGRWRLIDLSSRNGTFLVGQGPLLKSHYLQSGEEIDIGHTRVRFLLPDHEVASTKLMPPGRMLADYFSSPMVSLAVLVVTMATFALNQFLEQGTEVKWQELLLQGVLFLSVPFIWACFWALIGRISVHDTRFSYHFSMGCLLVLWGLAATTVLKYLDFGLNSHGILAWLEAASDGLVVGSLIVASLMMSTNMLRRKRWLVGNAVAGSLVGLVLLFEYVAKDEYRDNLGVQTLKPPFAQLSPSVDSDKLLSNLDSLIDELE